MTNKELAPHVEALPLAKAEQLLRDPQKRTAAFPECDPTLVLSLLRARVRQG